MSFGRFMEMSCVGLTCCAAVLARVRDCSISVDSGWTSVMVWCSCGSLVENSSTLSTLFIWASVSLHHTPHAQR